MGMLTTEALARFCIEQSLSFDAHDWLLLTEFDEKKVGLAAKYLSMTSWYGHEEDLEAIAGYAHIFDSTTAGLGGGDELRQPEFDLLQFSTAVRMGVTRARAFVQSQATKARRSRRRYERNAYSAIASTTE